MVSMDTASTGSDEAMAVSRYKSLLRAYGRREQYATPYDLLEAAVGYFEYAEMNPLQEEKVFNGKDGIVRTDVDKVRAFTKAALAHHIGWTTSKLDTMRHRGGQWEEVADLIDEVIRNQKYENAAAGLLSSSIVSRDLGLAEKHDHTSSDGSMTPKAASVEITNEMSAKEAAEAYAATLASQ